MHLLKVQRTKAYPTINTTIPFVESKKYDFASGLNKRLTINQLLLL